jgi:hypothetical protein
MKRVLSLQESADDERHQALLNALAVGNLSFALSDIQPLLYAFRVHPWRLLRLMSAHREWGQAVERAIAQYWPTFWYDVCLYAFPDIVVQLSLCETYEREIGADAYYHIFSGAGGGTAMYFFLAYCNNVDYGPQVAWNMARLFAIADGGLPRHRPTLTEFNTLWLHPSFTSLETRDACHASETRARDVASCYKMMHPCGIPPAAYCFASQVALQRLALELRVLLSRYDSEARRHYIIHGGVQQQRPLTVQFYRAMRTHYTVMDDDWLTFTMANRQNNVSLADLEKFLHIDPATTEGYTSVGGHEMGRAYKGHVMTLHHLADILRALYNELQPAVCATNVTCDAFAELYDRIVKAALRYDTRDDDTTEFPALVDSSLPWVPLAVEGEEESIEEMRTRDIERYGTHDPLYQTVMLQRGVPEPGHGQADWKQIIKTQIDVVKRDNKGRGRPTAEYLDIQSATPPLSTYVFACMNPNCGETTRTQFGVEDVAPFRVYCDEKCRMNV